MAYYKNKNEYYISWSQDTFTWKVTQGLDQSNEALLRIHREGTSCFLEKDENSNRRKREAPLISSEFKDEQWKIFDSENLKWLSDQNIILQCL